MTENVHLRARELSAKLQVEGISNEERAWLDGHARDCKECAGELLATQELLRALRSVPVTVPRDLAARTQLRVRLRAQEAVQGPEGNSIWLWLITAMSWLLGIFSAPLVWRGFTWVGGHFSIPKFALEMGFVLWWVVPALFAVGAILHQRAMSAAYSRGQR